MNSPVSQGEAGAEELAMRQQLTLKARTKMFVVHSKHNIPRLHKSSPLEGNNPPPTSLGRRAAIGAVGLGAAAFAVTR